MTIDEMHIAVNLGVQKSGSFQVDNLLPEEIDHELNLSQRRFIKQRYNARSNKDQRGFEQSQKRTDDLRHLVEDYVAKAPAGVSAGSFMGPIYTSNITGQIYAERYKLPLDYMHLVNIRSMIFYNCLEDLVTKNKTTSHQYLRIQIYPPSRNHVLVAISVAALADGNAVTIFETPSGATIDDLRDPTRYLGSEGFRPSISPNDSYTDLVDTTEAADSPPADANEIFLIRDTDIWSFGDFNGGAHTGAYALVHYKNLHTGDVVIVNIMSPPRILPYITRRVDPKGKGVRLKRTLCKAVQHDDIYKLLDDPFNTIKESNILYTMQENFVDLYSTSRLLPTEVVIKYLRRPLQMSLALGRGCEMAEHTHNEIVEMAIKSILEFIESPRYQSQSGEVLESE